MNVPVCVRIIFGHHELRPVVCRLEEERQKYLAPQIEVSFRLYLGYPFVGQRYVCHRQHGAYLFEIELVRQRDLHVAVTHQRLVQRLKHPARARVPVSERIGIAAFCQKSHIAVAVDGSLYRVLVAVRRVRVVHPVVHLPQYEIDIPYIRILHIARIHRRGLQVYVSVHRIFAAPVADPLARPHTEQSAGTRARTAKIRVSAGVVSPFGKRIVDGLVVEFVCGQRIVGHVEVCAEREFDRVVLRCEYVGMRFQRVAVKEHPVFDVLVDD